MFKKDDKVKVISGVNAFIGKTGIVMESNDNEVKVQFTLADNDIENKKIINVFEATQLELDSIDNLLNESEEIAFENDLEENNDKNYIEEPSSVEDDSIDSVNEESTELNKNEISLTEAQLEKWMDDNDAEYWTQDIVDNKVSIRSFALREELGIYDFEKKVLTLNVPEEVDNEFEIEDEDPDFIYPYIHEVNIDDSKDVIPGWEFAGIISAGERMDENVVIECAQDLGYKVFCIDCMNNVIKVIIAAKSITEENIIEDYAKYLDVKPVIRELKK